MDKGPVSAEVKVLTAEVRVLMVGSRQITRSVFRQLDVVDYEGCDPMGRVNEEGGYWIVGRDMGGNLVRARFRERPTFGGAYRLKELRRGSLWINESAKVELVKLEQEEGECIDLFEEWLGEKYDYDRLPLIVLAGLR